MLSDENSRFAYYPGMYEDLADSREGVAARLEAVRNALGLSKKEFGAKAGLSEQTYGPFEKKRRDLTLDAAKKLRAAHGLSLEFLFFGKIDDLPTRISRMLTSMPSVKSSQISNE